MSNIQHQLAEEIKRKSIDLFSPLYTRVSDLTRRGHHLNARKLSSDQVYEILNEAREIFKREYASIRSEQPVQVTIDNKLVDELQPDFNLIRGHYDYADAVNLLKRFAAITEALHLTSDKYVVDAELKEITGFDTKEEWQAYEKGQNDYDVVVRKKIEAWDGKATNSGLYDLLKKKFESLQSNSDEAQLRRTACTVDNSIGQGNPKIYGASKTKHAWLWRSIRGEYNIISTWIDEAGEGESKDLADLQHRCIKECIECDAMIVYREDEDYLKGAFIEMGVALAFCKPVYLVGNVLPKGSAFTHNPKVILVNTIAEALKLIHQGESVAVSDTTDSKSELQSPATQTNKLICDCSVAFKAAHGNCYYCPNNKATQTPPKVEQTTEKGGEK